MQLYVIAALGSKAIGRCTIAGIERAADRRALGQRCSGGEIVQGEGVGAIGIAAALHGQRVIARRCRDHAVSTAAIALAQRATLHELSIGAGERPHDVVARALRVEGQLRGCGEMETVDGGLAGQGNAARGAGAQRQYGREIRHTVELKAVVHRDGSGIAGDALHDEPVIAGGSDTEGIAVASQRAVVHLHTVGIEQTPVDAAAGRRLAVEVQLLSLAQRHLVEVRAIGIVEAVCDGGAGAEGLC